jgi:hypothetical protein
MTLKIINNNHFEMPPEVAISKDFLIKSLAQKCLTLSLKFLARQINHPIILGQKIREVGQSFWDEG